MNIHFAMVSLDATEEVYSITGSVLVEFCSYIEQLCVWFLPKSIAHVRVYTTSRKQVYVKT